MSPANSSKKPRTNWADAYAKPDPTLHPVESSPADGATPAADEQTDTVSSAPAEAPAAATKVRRPYNTPKIEKRQVGVRLTPDVFEIIARVKAEAAEEGYKLSNDEVVIRAVRGFYGKSNRRR